MRACRLMLIVALVSFCGCSRQDSQSNGAFRKDLPPNEELEKLLTTPLPPDADALQIAQRCTEIKEAIRPESETDFAVLRLLLRYGSGQEVSLVTSTGPTDGMDLMSFAAANAMPKFGKRAIPFLIDDLKNESDSCRFWTIVALEKFGPEAAAALPPLEEALTDDNERVQRAAKSAIEAIQGQAR